MKRIVTSLGLLLVLVFLIAAAALWIRNQPVRRTFDLPDGTTLTFLGATFGTNHTAPNSHSFTRWLPSPIARMLRLSTPRSSRFQTTQPKMMVWFERVGVRASPSRNWTCGLLHSDGFESQFDNITFFGSSSPTNEIMALTAPYPRRESSLRVRVYAEPRWRELELLGECRVRNPNPIRVPRPRPALLPQTDSDGDLTVTLVSLVTGGVRSRQRQTNVANVWTRARFQIQQQDVPTVVWSPVRMEATDSTGNQLVSHNWSGQSEDGQFRCEFQPMLWPNEAYSLRFEFSRKPPAVFRPEEIWTITNIAIPTNGAFTLINATNELQGVTVTFHGLNSVNGSAPWDQKFGGAPSLGFSLSTNLAGYRFSLLRMTDDRGRTIESSGSGYSDTKYGFGLRLKEESRSLELTVALHQSRFVEFTAMPERTE